MTLSCNALYYQKLGGKVTPRLCRVAKYLELANHEIGRVVPAEALEDARKPSAQVGIDIEDGWVYQWTQPYQTRGDFHYFCRTKGGTTEHYWVQAGGPPY